MTTATDLIRDCDHILLGFDGVLCTFDQDDQATADRLKILVSPGLPASVAASGDPFEVLDYAATCGTAAAVMVERQLRRLEMSTVIGALAMPGALTAARRLAAAGYTLTAISGLSTEVVRSVLSLHDLAGPIRRIAARTSASTPLPPDPHLLHQAMQALGASPQRCVLVAGSVNDLKAAAAADLPAIGYASTPAAAARLLKHGATAVIQNMAELASEGAPEFAWKL